MRSSVLPNNLQYPSRRKPEERGARHVPSDTIIVSADSHFTLSEDIFFENFPANIRNQAPRVWLEGGVWQVGIDGKSLLPPAVRAVIATYDEVPGASNVDARRSDLAAEGIEKELVFGNNALVVTRIADFAVREAATEIYNDYMADLATTAPDTFYPVAYGHFWDPAGAADHIGHLVDRGYRLMTIPQFPGGGPDGRPINYAWPEMDPFWAAVEESGLVLAFHVGESAMEGPGGIGGTALGSLGPMRKVMGELIFGGIFDRHPGLRVMFTEAGFAWIASALHDAEMIVDSYGDLLEPKLKERPSYYWHNNCYATFITDPVGFELIDVIGADRIMWGQDYPHCESAFGYSWSAIESIVKATSPSDARLILGETAMQLFRL